MQGDISFDVNGSRMGHNGIYQLGECHIARLTKFLRGVFYNPQPWCMYIRIYVPSYFALTFHTVQIISPSATYMYLCMWFCAVPTDDGEGLRLDLLYVQDPHQYQVLPQNLSEWRQQPQWKGQPQLNHAPYTNH